MIPAFDTCLIAVIGWTDLAIGGVVGVVLAVVVFVARNAMLASSQRQQAEGILQDARREAETLIKAAKVDAKAEALKRQEEFAKESSQVRAELKETEKRLSKREDSLEGKLDTLATKERNVDSAEQKLAQREKQITAKEIELAETLDREKEELIRISGLSVDEAKRRLLENVKHDIENDAARLIDKTLTDAKDEADEKAREIIITAIQRSAAEHTSASTVSTVDIPSDEMKGRVIGREGRNIRAFEKATGVDV
ncbi:MAG: DUF3552 domain-containing protein, partial [Planctomycetes bacterium]|nr:DUF3552 domain-containing protein [Planctomycetota bacterium]